MLLTCNLAATAEGKPLAACHRSSLLGMHLGTHPLLTTMCKC